jgi:lysozyme
MSYSASEINLDRLKNRLRISEGWRSRVYRDTVGHLTIGYGHNLDAKGITPKAGDVILSDDIEDAIRDLDAIPWWRTLSSARQGVLADMSFNMGIHGLLTFRNTLEAMRRGNYESAAAGMLASKWARQVGRRADRLATIMRTGEDKE